MRAVFILCAIFAVVTFVPDAKAEDEDPFAFLNDGSMERGQDPDPDAIIGILIKVKIVKVVKVKTVAGEQEPAFTAASSGRAPAAKTDAARQSAPILPNVENGVTNVDFGQKVEAAKPEQAPDPVHLPEATLLPINILPKL